VNSITHLAPCMHPMAIGAKQTQVAFVGFPVFKAVKPVSSALSFFELFFSINVVNVKNSMVINAAFNAFAAKCSNQGKLFLPVLGVLMGRKAVFVPVVSPARIATKPVFTLFAAIFAGLFFPPSVRQVASLTAKLTSSIFKPVGVNLKLFGAVFTALRHLCFLTHLHLLNTYAHYKPKYFDIACKRIERAVSQGKLFTHEPIKQIQNALFDGGK